MEPILESVLESGLFPKPIYRLAGDKGLIVEFGNEIDPKINARVRAMSHALEKSHPPGVNEIIPTYRSILLIYDPEITNPDKLSSLIDQISLIDQVGQIDQADHIDHIDHIDKVDKAGQAENTLETMEADSFRIVEIPVCYGGEFGPDMKNVQKAHKLSSQKVIHLHSSPEYLIYMVGFTPGFAFLGGLDEKLYTPRLETPRMLVPEGSVGIANNQTGMYPVASPGGWQIIGRTPLKLFAPDRSSPFLYKAGDKIKFTPISEQKYAELKEKEKTS
ncbi:MAG: 5-oxoprolinase subunit PxpB [Desulfobacula sp.]|jgi:inhibitor of KinA|nr:5-oxoprolinase subunit PxpB [Desulfobacula sp.]